MARTKSRRETYDSMHLHRDWGELLAERKMIEQQDTAYE